MPTKQKKYHGGRALLNLPGHESTAAIVVEIENTAQWKKGKGYDGTELKHRWEATPSTLFQFANCDRSISFTLSMDGEDNVANSLHKLDTMIEILSAARNGFVIEAQRYADRVESLDDDE